MPPVNKTTRSALSGLIPTAVAKLIIDDMEKISFVAQGLGLERMTGSTENTVFLDSAIEPDWVDEDFGEKKTSTITSRATPMKAEELATILIISDNTLRDANGDIVAAIRKLAPKAFMKKMDKTVLYGGLSGYNKPTSFPDGLVKEAIERGNTIERGSGMDLAEDVSDMMSLVEDDEYDVNIMATGRKLRGDLRGLRDANGGLLYQPSLQAGTPNRLYDNDLLYVNNGAWDHTIAQLLAGDKEAVRVAIWEQMAYKISQDATVVDEDGVPFSAFQRDATFVRITMRLGWQWYTRDNSVFPFSVIEPA
jgi:HK97 family phage major capsid protein